MDRELAMMYITMDIKPETDLSTGRLTYLLRPTVDDIERLEDLKQEKLVEEWKNSVHVIDFMSSFSIYDLMMQGLRELELESRGVPMSQLGQWYHEIDEQYQ